MDKVIKSKAELDEYLAEIWKGKPSLWLRIIWIWHDVLRQFDRLKYAFQRAFRGYDDLAKWSFHSHVVDAGIPILKYMLRPNAGCEWGIGGRYVKARPIIRKVLRAFELMQLHDECKRDWSKRDQKAIDEGLKLFGKYFQHFWD